MFIRAVTGFALVLVLLHGKALKASLQSPAFMAAKADLAAARPGAKLLAEVDSALRVLSRNGTRAAVSARRPPSSI